MKQCPHCEAPCPDRAIVCPHCGYLFSVEMRGDRWEEAPWHPWAENRRPRTPGNAGGILPTDTGAMMALAFGLTAFFGAWFIAGIPLAIPGLICGLKSLRRIRQAAGGRAGESFAQAGIAFSVLALGVGLCLFMWILLNWPEFYRGFPQEWDSAIRQLRS